MSSNLVRFQKKDGPGRFYIRSGRGIKLVKPGEIISVSEDVLEKHLDEFIRLDPEPLPPKQIATRMMEQTLDGDGWNVYLVYTDGSRSDKPINDKPLTKENAETLLDGCLLDEMEADAMKLEDDNATEG